MRGDHFVNEHGALFVVTPLFNGESALCNIGTGDLHRYTTRAHIFHECRESLTLVNVSYTYNTPIAPGDRYMYNGTEYMVCRVGKEIFALINLSSGDRFTDPREDINEIFGAGFRDLFTPITKQ